VYDAIYIENKGKPAVPFVYKYFINDALSAASSKGMPGIRVTLENIVSECSDKEEIENGVKEVIDEAIANLTRALTAEEQAPRSKEPENPARIVFKGNLAEVNRFFYRRGWTDGLPIIPPTEEAVAEMLTGTDLPADHVVAALVPRRGKATVEKIAVNAVMAGCLPTYMPVLIAGVKNLQNNRGADMMAVSTGSWAPFWIVNGPVRQAINMNNSYGAMNPGEVASMTIGRALGLITKNIRGIRKGVEDMGVLGNPGKFAMVAAENEEDSPWEPLHVEHGLKKEDSAISLTFPQSYDQFYPYGTDDYGLLRTVAYNLMPVRLGITGVILTPTNARSLARRGWTKQSIKKYIMENAKVPYSHNPHYYGGIFNEGEKNQAYKAEDLVPIIEPNPQGENIIQIYVFGGMGSWVGIATGGGHISTEKIDLPKNWDALVKKYRDVVPSYVRY
jgi:hypothetical protein